MTRPVAAAPLTLWTRLALAQGIVAPLIYLGVIVVGGALRPGYTHLNQAVSELTEAGAVNKPWLDAALVVMELATVAFGAGFLAVVRRVDAKLAASAALMIAIGIVGLGFARYPMDPMGSPMTPDGRMHLVIVSISAVAAIVSVSLSSWGWWRVPGARWLAWFGLAMLTLMLASGVASGAVGASGGAGIGLLQRVNTAAFGLWQIATALTLLRNGARLRGGRA